MIDLFQESFVVLHHQLRLQLLIEFHGYGYDDEDTGRGEYVHQVQAYPAEYHGRNERNQGKINSAEQSDSVRNFREVFRSRFTGTNTLNKAAVLLNALCHVVGLELHLRIEECKPEDKQTKNDGVNPSTLTHPSIPPRFRRRTGEEDA